MTKTHLNNGNDNKINVGVPPHSCFNDCFLKTLNFVRANKILYGYHRFRTWESTVSVLNGKKCIKKE